MPTDLLQNMDNRPLGPELLANPETRKTFSGPARKAFIRLADVWKLSIPERCTILTGVTPHTYHKWDSSDECILNADQLERIGIILGIHKRLQMLFSDEAGSLRWLTSPNSDYAFKGSSPAQRIARGALSDICAVRDYIDAMLSG